MSRSIRSGRPRGLRGRLIALSSVAVLAATGLQACGSGGSSSATNSAGLTPTTSASPSPSPSPTVVPTTPTPALVPPHSPSATAVTTLTDEQLAGQRVIYSYTGLTPPTSLLTAIREGDAAGVIFFGDNISTPAQVGSAIKQLVEAQQESPIHQPLLLMTDQEGGEVRRLPGAPALSEKQVGEASNPSAAATQAGIGAGQNLAGVGMNVNLAPVLDVYYQAGNFIDGTQRSYSHSASVVSQLGADFIKAQQGQEDVAATAKHFPGLGSAPAGANTDEKPVTLSVSLNQLRTIDEVPYKAAIASGVKLIMVSWAVYPALDSSRPAGLSSVVVQQELRDRLGFKGVTITDALEAGALKAYGTPGERALDAANAGMDLLLCSSGSVTQGQEATSALASALSSGQLNQDNFIAAVERISALRGGLR
jgi:beta-N-acetylhexosaminidase